VPTNEPAPLHCPPPELAVVVPTYGEADNVDELVRRVGRALRGIDWELIFVDDDSPDGTAERVRTLARRDRRVHRLVHRSGNPETVAVLTQPAVCLHRSSGRA
jgi:dolichol-phosphate mannosyltransferase